MSPRYERWKDVPKEVREGIRDFSPQKPINFKNDGVVAKIVDGQVLELYFQNEVEPWVLREAQRQSSDYFLVKGVKDELSQRREKRLASLETSFADIDSDNCKPKGGYSGHDYRGNHRSHTKGIGARNFFKYAVGKSRDRGGGTK